LNIGIAPVVVFDMADILTLADKNTRFCFRKLRLCFPNFQLHIKNGVKKWQNSCFFGNLKSEIGVFGVASQVLGGSNMTLSLMRLFF
jgi:hypothetical protein